MVKVTSRTLQALNRAKYAKRIMPIVKPIVLQGYHSSGPLLCNFACDVIDGPWPEAEESIATDGSYSFYYAVYALKGRFPLGEKALLEEGNTDLVARYAIEVLNARWPQAEDKIKDSNYCIWYAERILGLDKHQAKIWAGQR